MKYTLEERIDIGRQIHTHELSRKEAMDKYSISHYTADTYHNLYKTSIGDISDKSKPTEPLQKTHNKKPIKINLHQTPDVERYMAMSKEELIDELIRTKANELRAKKGYEVKGVGANKEFISLNSKNTK